jgi:pimeloyl-ACP methyl ester carboxylesterase
MTKVARFGPVDLHIEGAGREAIVMVHGWPDSYRLWDGVVDELKNRYRCVRFTLPGFERGSTHRVYLLDEVVDLLGRIIQEQCGGRAILLLHDWGCVFGYELAMRRPELVTRIVGVDVGDTRSLPGVWTAREKGGLIAYQVWLALAWKIGGRVGDGMTRRLAQWGHWPGDGATIGAWMNYPYWLAWFGGAHAYRRRVQHFRPACPMLFVYGRNKAIRFHTIQWAEDLAACPANRVVELDTGHWVMLEARQRFNEAVRDWLSAGEPRLDKPPAKLPPMPVA